ncbi:hypothetical protein Q7P37_002410 [Cladosporium fusiforme]
MFEALTGLQKRAGMQVALHSSSPDQAELKNAGHQSLISFFPVRSCSFPNFWYRSSNTLRHANLRNALTNTLITMTNIDISHDLSLEQESYCAQPCKHHPVAPQYPNGNSTEHLQDLPEFVRTIAAALSRVVLPRPQHQYSRVHALMISWEDDDLGTETDIRHLQRIFENSYRFTTEHFKLSSNNPEYLEKILVDTKFEHGMNDDGLLIIYYGGHGAVDKRTQHSVWKAWKQAPRGTSAGSSPELDWSRLHDRLESAKGDVLFILDCCYAAVAVNNSTQRQIDGQSFLVASADDKASNENSLTRAIIRELEILDKRSITVFSLHANIMANQSIHKWITAPIHIGETRILLAPLPDAAAPNSPVASFEQDLDQLKSDCRILVAVALKETGAVSAEDVWVEWFRNAPPEIASIDFRDIITPVAAHTSNSYHLIFTLPVSVWNAMTPNPAIQFLSIVYTGNLLYWNNDDPLLRSTAAAESDPRGFSNRLNQLLGTRPPVEDLTSLPHVRKGKDHLVASLRPDLSGPNTSLIPWASSPLLGEHVWNPRTDMITGKLGQVFPRPDSVPQSALRSATWEGLLPWDADLRNSPAATSPPLQTKPPPKTSEWDQAAKGKRRRKVRK